MDRREFDSALENASLPVVLLFEGDEEQLKQEAVEKLRKALLPDGLEQMNETVLENPDTDQLIAAAETIPFLADRRLVIVRDHPALAGRAEADEKLLSYLPSVPPTAVLLFLCTGKPDGRKKLYNAVKKLGGIVTFAPLKGAELTRFAVDAFRGEGRECPARVAEYLVFTVGSDAGQLRNEISKISAYMGDRTAVTADDVSALATPSEECTVFQMVDAVVAGQKGRAFTLMNSLLRSGTDRMNILALLLRQYRFLQHIKIMQYEKKSREFIRSALGVPPFALDQYFRQASAYTGGQAKRAASLCFEAEYAVKSGRQLPDSALEALIIKLLTIRQKD